MVSRHDTTQRCEQQQKLRPSEIHVSRALAFEGNGHDSIQAEPPWSMCPDVDGAFERGLHGPVNGLLLGLQFRL